MMDSLETLLDVNMKAKLFCYNLSTEKGIGNLRTKYELKTCVSVMLHSCECSSACANRRLWQLSRRY
jgi:hypothetical protein